MKSTLIAVFALSAGLGLAASLPASDEKGKGPCAEDAAKFCKDVKPGEGRLAACLKEHEKELSKACLDRKALAAEKRGGKRGGKRGKKEGGGGQAAYGKACAADREKFCAGVKPGEGRLRDCLRKNLESLSEGCKALQEKSKERPEEKEKKPKDGFSGD